MSTSPFKIAKSKTTRSKTSMEFVQAPDGLKARVDDYKNLMEQVKHLEGEVSVHKSEILDFCHSTIGERIMLGQKTNFKIQGDEKEVTFIAQDRAVMFSSDAKDELIEKYGEDIEDLFEEDYSALKFNEDVLLKNKDQVFEALQTLPSEILDNLFKPMTLRVKKGAYSSVGDVCKTKDQASELLKDLNMRMFIK